jgi:hypothetical protein
MGDGASNVVRLLERIFDAEQVAMLDLLACTLLCDSPDPPFLFLGKKAAFCAQREHLAHPVERWVTSLRRIILEEACEQSTERLVVSRQYSMFGSFFDLLFPSPKVDLPTFDLCAVNTLSSTVVVRPPWQL